jgi:hypothetical protein
MISAPGRALYSLVTARLVDVSTAAENPAIRRRKSWQFFQF